MTMKINTYRVTDAVYKQLITDDSGKLKYKPVGRARKKKGRGGKRKKAEMEEVTAAAAAAAVSTRTAQGSRGRRG